MLGLSKAKYLVARAVHILAYLHARAGVALVYTRVHEVFVCLMITLNS